jgi:hypothetical protein
MATGTPWADLEHPELVLAKNKLQGVIAKVDNVDAVARSLGQSSLVLVSGLLAYISPSCLGQH